MKVCHIKTWCFFLNETTLHRCSTKLSLKWCTIYDTCLKKLKSYRLNNVKKKFSKFSIDSLMSSRDFLPRSILYMKSHLLSTNNQKFWFRKLGVSRLELGSARSILSIYFKFNNFFISPGKKIKISKTKSSIFLQARKLIELNRSR